MEDSFAVKRQANNVGTVAKLTGREWSWTQKIPGAGRNVSNGHRFYRNELARTPDGGQAVDAARQAVQGTS